MMEDTYEWSFISSGSEVNKLMEMLNKRHSKESRLKDTLKKYSLLFMLIFKIRLKCRFWEYQPRQSKSSIFKCSSTMESMPCVYEEHFEGLKDLEKFFALYNEKCEEETPLKEFVKNQLKRV